MLTSRSRRCVIALAVVAAPFAGCRYQPTPIPLQASVADISALAGRWEGEYASLESGRNGIITFSVQPGRDTAYGDVVMVPAQGHDPIFAADVASGMHARHSAAPELLRIALVRVVGGFVEGVLEPYTAPDCKCVVSTTFRGALQGNTIKGDYLTTGAYGLRQTGSWSVSRKQGAETKANANPR